MVDPKTVDERRALMQEQLDYYAIHPNDAAYARVLIQALFSGDHPPPDRLYVIQVQPLRATFTWSMPWGRVALHTNGQSASVTSMFGSESEPMVIVHNSPGVKGDFRPLLEYAFSHPDISM